MNDPVCLELCQSFSINNVIGFGDQSSSGDQSSRSDQSSSGDQCSSGDQSINGNTQLLLMLWFLLTKVDILQ